MPKAQINKTAYAILGMLSIHSMSGYDIRQMIKQSTQNFWSESDGQLYPALEKLTKQGLISCKLAKTINPRKKKLYFLTTKGANELKQWLLQKPETQSVRNETLLKLFFGANVESLVNQEHVTAYQYQTKIMLLQLNKTRKKVIQENEKSPHLFYWLVSIDYGIEIAEAKLKWCKKVINNLNKMSIKTR